MAFIPTPNCTRTDILFMYEGQQDHNVIWCQWPAPATQAQREGLNTAIRDWWTASGKAMSTQGYVLSQITTVNQDADNAPSSTLVVSPGIAGSAGTSGLPANTALCATLRTALRGRSYRGRMYLGGMDVTKRDQPSTTTTVFIGQVIVMLNALRDAITAAGAIWVVVSKVHNLVKRSSGVATALDAISIDSVFDSQRRRLPGRGV